MMKLNLEEAIENGVEQAINDYELKIGMTLKQAVEKQIPKKIKISLKGTTDWNTKSHCPNCHSMVLRGKYCANCGQALDWSEGE